MNTDFCVIGGGIAGLSIASELLPHARVMVLEREADLAYHTTGRSASLYSELVASSTALALTKLSRAFLVEPPQGFSEAPLHREIGCLFTANAGQEALLDEKMPQHSGLRRLNPEQMLALMPKLKTGGEAIAAGVLEPGAFKIEVGALVEGYRKRILSGGGRIRNQAEVAAIRATAGGWELRLGNGESLKASRIINAAGAWGDLVAGMAGIAPLGLNPMRRTIITFNPPEGIDTARWPAVGGIEGGYYILPEAGRLIGSAADEVPSPPCDAQPEEYDIALAAYNIECNTTLEVRQIQHKWAGLRTFAPDRQLVAGYEHSNPGFFWYVGQGGAGIQTAPAAARAAAELALEKPLPMKFEALGVTAKILSPGRFR